MNLKSGMVFATAVFTVCAAPAATVITFDDIPFPGSNPLAAAAPPIAYQGLAWGSAWTVSPNHATGWYGGALQPYAHSPSNFAWNSGGDSYGLSVPGGGTFDLTSFWARTWPAISVSATAHGFRNGVEVYTQSFSLDNSYVLVTLNFTNIDRFSTTTPGPQFLIDDLGVDNISPVPEPASAALLLAGLGGLVGLAARRRRT